MDVTNAQRALWSVLITTIAAPLVAALVAAALAALGQVTGFTIPVFADSPLSAIAVAGFIWAAVPAIIASVGLIPYVLQSGTYGWLHAAAAGVVGFAGGVFVSAFEAAGFLPVFAFTAGLVMLGIRAMLIRGGILKHED